MPTKIGRTQYVTATEAAEMLGIKLDSFTSSVSRALARRRQYPDARIIFPMPATEIAGRRFYKLRDVTHYRDNKPGMGARTDLAPKRKTKAKS